MKSVPNENIKLLPKFNLSQHTYERSFYTISPKINRDEQKTITSHVMSHVNFLRIMDIFM